MEYIIKILPGARKKVKFWINMVK